MTRIAEALRRAGRTTGEPFENHREHAGTSAEVSRLIATDESTPSIEADVLRAGGPVVSVPGAAPSSLRSRHFDPALAGKLVATPNIAPVVVEQYRKLAATLHHAQLERGIKVVMLVSAVPGEGKSLTATNLALTFSGSYRRRVLLIDADLRRPTIHQIFQVPNLSGLTDGLKAETPRQLPLIQVSPFLTLLTAGRPDPDPMSSLVSTRMKQVIQEAAATFDWVLIDTPPVGLLSDAKLLAGMVDAALLVIRAGKSPFRLIQQAVEAVGPDRILGVVLNGADEASFRSGHGYYGGYEGYGPRSD